MKSMLIMLCLAASAMAADDTRVTSLMARDLTGIAGKEGAMVTVEYAPGASSAVHRHNAYTFVYVLEGSVVMQVKGGKEVTLGPGQTFYESPDDIHTVFSEGQRCSANRAGKVSDWIVAGTGHQAGNAARSILLAALISF